MRRYATLLAWVQGAYFILAGLWPLASLAAFSSFMGKTPATWVVDATGALMVVVGGDLLATAARRKVTPGVAALAGGCALVLAIADVVLVSTDTLGARYLLDAIPEIAFVLLWGLVARREKGA